MYPMTYDPTYDVLINVIYCVTGGIHSVATGADERCSILFTASWDTDITVWDCIRNQMVTKLTGHTNTVTSIAVDTQYL